MGFIPTEEHLKAPGDPIKEPGNYNLRVVEIENVIAGTGTPGYKLKLQCTESGKTMNERLWETEKAFWRICRFAKACSVQIRQGDELTIDDSFVGKTFDAEVRMGEPNDKGDQYAEIADFGEGEHDSLFSDKAPAKEAPKTEAPKSGGKLW